MRVPACSTVSPGAWLRLCFSVSLAMPALTLGAQAQSLLTHHVRPAVANGEARLTGRMPAEQLLKLDLVLPLRDQAGLEALLNQINDPSSSSYRRFLTVAQFTDRFGPTPQDYDEVVRFAHDHGLMVIGGSRDGMDVQVVAPVSAIEGTLHVNMLTYRHPSEDRIFYAPDREPAPNLAVKLWHISGLDNYSIPHPLYVSKGAYAQEHGIYPEDVVKHATTGSDMRAA